MSPVLPRLVQCLRWMLESDLDPKLPLPTKARGSLDLRSYQKGWTWAEKNVLTSPPPKGTDDSELAKQVRQYNPERLARLMVARQNSAFVFEPPSKTNASKFLKVSGSKLQLARSGRQGWRDKVDAAFWQGVSDYCGAVIEYWMSGDLEYQYIRRKDGEFREKLGLPPAGMMSRAELEAAYPLAFKRAESCRRGL